MRLCPLKDETRLDLLLLVPSKGLSAKLVDWSVRVCEGCTQEAAVHAASLAMKGWSLVLARAAQESPRES